MHESPTTSARRAGLGDQSKIPYVVQGRVAHRLAIVSDLFREVSHSFPRLRHALAHFAQSSNGFCQKRLGHTMESTLLSMDVPTVCQVALVEHGHIRS